MPDNNYIERISLYRGGVAVTGLFDSFGKSIKETRITAALAYLFALSPEKCREFLSINADIRDITIEAFHERSRADIQIETVKKKRYVVEAKLPNINPFEQSLKYKADYRILITNFPFRSHNHSKKTKYVSWSQTAEFLNRLTQSKNHSLKTLSNELLDYLQRYNMLRKDDTPEIYMRELNRIETLELFLKSHLYICPFQKASRLPEARYFAPHFGKKISQLIPGIYQGISYVAKIEDVAMVQSKDQLRKVVFSERVKRWYNHHRKYILSAIDGKINESNAKSIVFLGQPRLVFNPPIKKEHIQKGSGWLSKQFISFDKLFNAWNK